MPAHRSIIAICALGFVSTLAAQTTETDALLQRIDALEARVQKLEQRWEKGLPVNRALKIEPEPGGWRNADNWKLLGRGMPYDDVLRILGEPDRTKRVQKFDYWHYGDGKVRLYLNRLKSWQIPSAAAN